MDQNNIYKNKHPKDFEQGSIIKIINSDKANLIGSLYMVITPVNISSGSTIYAIRLNFSDKHKNYKPGNIFTNRSIEFDIELIQGKLKHD